MNIWVPFGHFYLILIYRDLTLGVLQLLATELLVLLSLIGGQGIDHSWAHTRHFVTTS